MTARELTTATIDGYLKLVRRPIDFTIGLLPDRRRGSSAAARLTVDRVDARIRAAAGSVLNDDRLSEDARRRNAAASERERAVKLRQEAGVKEKQAQARLQTRHEEATQRRDRASKAAAARREQAAGKQQTRARTAADSERKRLQASREQEARVDETIGTQVSKARLPAVEEQARALAEQDVALKEHDEAQRLGDAAARIKSERKDA
jgi:hypothetical protein